MKGLKELLAILLLVALATTLAFAFLTADPEINQLYQELMDE